MARRGLSNFNPGMLDRLRLGWRLLRDPRIPTWPKMLAPTIMALYVLLPTDVIPDFFPLLGQVDDVGVIALALAAVSMLTRWSPPEVVAQHASALGLVEDFDQASARYNERAADSRGQGKKDEPIEATYWVDDWR